MVDPLKDEDAIFCGNEELIKQKAIKVEKPLVKFGLLRLELKGEYCGKILIDRREHPLTKEKRTRLYFNATALGTGVELPQEEKEARLRIRKAICDKLQAIDMSDSVDQYR